MATAPASRGQREHQDSQHEQGQRGKGEGLARLMVPLMLVLFISNLDATVVSTAVASIGRSLHDASGASWIATAYLLTSAVTTLVLGKLGDIYGRKPVFQFSIAVFLIGSVLCGTAHSMLWLVLWRGLQGIGGGGLNSLVMAIIGGAVFPALMGYVSDLTSIRTAFAVPLFCYLYIWYFAARGSHQGSHLVTEIA